MHVCGLSESVASQQLGREVGGTTAYDAKGRIGPKGLGQRDQGAGAKGQGVLSIHGLFKKNSKKILLQAGVLALFPKVTGCNSTG